MKVNFRSKGGGEQCCCSVVHSNTSVGVPHLKALQVPKGRTVLTFQRQQALMCRELGHCPAAQAGSAWFRTGSRAVPAYCCTSSAPTAHGAPQPCTALWGMPGCSCSSGFTSQVSVFFFHLTRFLLTFSCELKQGKMIKSSRKWHEIFFIAPKWSGSISPQPRASFCSAAEMKNCYLLKTILNLSLFPTSADDCLRNTAYLPGNPASLHEPQYHWVGKSPLSLMPSPSHHAHWSPPSVSHLHLEVPKTGTAPLPWAAFLTWTKQLEFWRDLTPPRSVPRRLSWAQHAARSLQFRLREKLGFISVSSNRTFTDICTVIQQRTPFRTGFFLSRVTKASSQSQLNRCQKRSFKWNAQKIRLIRVDKNQARQFCSMNMTENCKITDKAFQRQYLIKINKLLFSQ